MGGRGDHGLERVAATDPSAGPFEQAHAGGGGEVEGLGATRVRDPHRRVGVRNDLLRESVRLVPEQQDEWSRQVGRVETLRAAGIHREDAEAAIPQIVDRLVRLDPANDREMEHGPGRRPNRLWVVEVDRCGREDHARGAGCVGRSEHRAGVPGITHLVQERDASLGRQRIERDVDECRDTERALRGDRRG